MSDPVLRAPRGTRSPSPAPSASSDSEGDDFLSDNSSFTYVSNRNISASPCSQSPTALLWIRMSSLRLHDSQAFNNALSDPSFRFRAVFLMDPWFETSKRLGLNRLRFMLESLHDLSKQLESYGKCLYVVQGHTLLSLERICEKWNVRKLFYLVSRDVGSFVMEDAVDNLVRSMNIEISKYEAHTLYNAKDLFSKMDGPLTTMKQFRLLVSAVGSPVPPCIRPEPPKLIAQQEEGSAPLADDQPDMEDYRIPGLSDFGYPASEHLYSNKRWVGGESQALKQLSLYIKKRKDCRPLSVDDLFDNAALSPYIRFGCMSVRYFFWAIREIAAMDPNYENLSRKVMSKLLQREFYFLMALEVPHFDQVEKNRLCLQLPWETDEVLLSRWKKGRTGYPWVDAAMRQLSQEGWIHHLLRECVGTFLTRGDLWISWEHGKDVFENQLLDFEPAVSCGCWMKTSCSAFHTGPVEHYCPITYGKKVDPHGTFVRKYIPELQNYPDEYVFSPWLAPLSVQIQAGCRVGQDYPSPVVDHRTAGVVCCEKLRLVMTMLQQANSSSFSPSCLITPPCVQQSTPPCLQQSTNDQVA